MPVINDYWERAEVPVELCRRLGELGLVGDGLDGYGCPPMSPTAAGLIAMELNRGDGSVGTFLGVQAGLAMRSIHMHGSEEQKQRWLPAMARCEKLGAFALTEPRHGSDSVSLETEARRDGDEYVINGAKRWIGNGTLADVVVLWARDTEDMQVKGFLIEKGTPGYDARAIEGKGSLRALWQADIDLTDVRVPAENRLPGANSFADTAKVLKATRASCAWSALGHAVAGYDAALNYAAQRTQFGKPLARFQIVQEKLVRMLCEITAMQLYCAAHRATRRHRGACPTRSRPWASSTTPSRPARCSPRHAICWAATASCSRTTSSGTWPTSRPSTPSRAPRRSKPCSSAGTSPG